MTGSRLERPWWTRRDFLKGGGAAVAGAYGLFPGFAQAVQVPNKFDGSGFKLAAPEPNAKSGGVLRVGMPNRAPHFDLHQSGTIFNLGVMGCMFDNLIRHDPRDSGKTIIPDLAQSWEISKDSKTYTFLLRKDVQFHDGAELTAEDVKATFDRIAKPPSGISIPRSILFKAVSEINAPDKYTVEFKLSEARPTNFIMAAIASGWNVIVRKKTLEDNNYNLRKVEVYPGTGPFRSLRRVENEIWVMERNPNYWNKGLPYLDGIEFYHVLPFSPEMASAILSGRVDYVRITDPVTARKAKVTPGMTTTDYYQSVIQATWVNNRRKPLDDPRVRRAMHLVLDKPVLVEVVKDVAPMMVGGFIYPFSEFATPKEELSKRLGYQPDPAAAVKEARALMAAAGHSDGIKGLDYMVREIASFKLWSQAIQAMLKESLNIECNLRTVVDSVWFDDAKNGNFDLAIGAIVSTLLDPSDYFNAWYGKDGPQNYSFWDNKEFQALSAQIDREVDAEKRQDLIRQAEAIMELDPPLLPISWEKINDVWYNYVKGHNPYEYFGVYDVVRLDTVWLDKA
ncbi:MAG TPA: ABC transporter substrate-binding protein [Stellaceae bacterium]|jgi:ABC-type transport system substrate-binding protein|nr:ABC transporter substrate-binding protein [Stellaceae bacterium]